MNSAFCRTYVSLFVGLFVVLFAARFGGAEEGRARMCSGRCASWRPLFGSRPGDVQRPLHSLAAPLGAPFWAPPQAFSGLPVAPESPLAGPRTRAPSLKAVLGLPMALATYLEGPPTKPGDVQRPLHILAACPPGPRPPESRSWPSRGTSGLSRRPPPANADPDGSAFDSHRPLLEPYRGPLGP